MVLMAVIAFLLVVLILLQRGRGGGLTGALGGMGGQSAFGSKAGDVFTRITSGLAIIWIVLCVGALKYVNMQSDLFDPQAGGAAPPAEETIEGRPADDSPLKSSPSAERAQPADANSGGGEEDK
ncbi:MAG TPA: preprotein translocase subunit SecG [Pirellulales bacterium]|nr:preprotein translocase subunit SecG [Pirellulales bacterium]